MKVKTNEKHLPTAQIAPFGDLSVSTAILGDSSNLTVISSDWVILELKHSFVNKIEPLIEVNLAISWIVFYYDIQLTSVKLFNES